MYVFIVLVKWPPIEKKAAHLTYDMFPISVFGVWISFWLRLSIAYLYLFMI